jgi:Zn-dependent M28 family amino/carboxypeptidase
VFTNWRVALSILMLGALLVASPTSSSLAAQTPPSFDGDAARQQVDALAVQIGSRPAGSHAYDQAVTYAVDQLVRWGYAPSLQTLPVSTYDDRGSQLDVTSADGTTVHVPAATLQNSIAGQLHAPLVAAGQGQPSDFAVVDARGKVALVQRGVQRFSEKVANAAAAGAVGVVVYNDAAGEVQGVLATAQPIPAATIAADSGQHLLAMLASGPVSANFSVDGETEQVSATNVIAELPGAQPDAVTVILSAHLDSVPAGPGANDNASGSAVVLELARELAQRSAAERPVTVRFALFGAEELGLYGSRYYVQSLSEADRRAVRADVNLDMVGVGDAWRFGGTEDLVQLALGAATDLGQRALPLHGALAGASDHASFLDAGVPAVFVYRVEDPNYHTAGDVAFLVDPRALSQAGTIALAVLEGVSASSVPTPNQRAVDKPLEGLHHRWNT